MVEQQGGHFRKPPEDGQVQRCAAVLVPGVHSQALLDQQARRRNGIAVGRHVEQRLPLIPRLEGIGPFVDHPPELFRVVGPYGVLDVGPAAADEKKQPGKDCGGTHTHGNKMALNHWSLRPDLSLSLSVER